MTLDMIPLICAGGGVVLKFCKCLRAEAHAVLKLSIRLS